MIWSGTPRLFDAGWFKWGLMLMVISSYWPLEIFFDNFRSQTTTTALADLEASQLLLSVQSFGVPVEGMEKLLKLLDVTMESNVEEMRNMVVDKNYMGQIIHVQHMRGATGGERFYQLLNGGVQLETDVSSPMEISTTGEKQLNVSMACCNHYPPTAGPDKPPPQTHHFLPSKCTSDEVSQLLNQVLLPFITSS